MYKILISKKAAKSLDDLPNNIFQKIDKVIFGLKYNPRPAGCLKLSNEELYRIRINDYRIIYSIHDAILKIEIIRIAHRKDVYKKK